jgi:hypothetical protein
VVTRTTLIVMAVLLVGAAGWGGFAQDESAPFAANGGVEAGPGSGLWGDKGSGPDGLHVGCLAHRHYALVVTLSNRSTSAATLTGARGADSAPRIIRRVAVQFRLAPPPPDGHFFGANLRHWSAAPAKPVTIPPGRSAVVQSNFVMRHCETLRRHRAVVINRSLVLSYRTAGHAGTQKVAQRSARIILGRGPTIRPCIPVLGSGALFAADIPCWVARSAAMSCRHLPHRSSGTCSAAGYAWNCTFTGRKRPPVAELCWLASKSQWFKVRWTE